MNFEAIKPRIFNAVAVGEIHLTVAPSSKRIADATHLKKPPRKNVVANIISPLISLPDQASFLYLQQMRVKRFGVLGGEVNGCDIKCGLAAAIAPLP